MDNANRKMSRRQVLTWGLGLASVSLLSACATSSPAATPAATAAATAAPKPAGTTAPAVAATPAPAAAGFDWMQQKGKSLVVSAVLAVYYPVLQKLVPEFQKKTGIEVDFQVIPEQQLRQKLPIELNAKSPAIDIYITSMHVEKILFTKAGWYEPLNKYLDNPKLTPPDYDWKDFGPAGTSWATAADGRIVAIPFGVGLGGFMWRQDLYEAKGIKAVLTMDDMVKSVKAVHNPPTVYGFVGRGLKNANIAMWGPFLMALGGNYLSADKKELTCT
ncbi:MAG: ABC transporter substrate-binding protein, partial [Chloroflexota bacterium]